MSWGEEKSGEEVGSNVMGVDIGSRQRGMEDTGKDEKRMEG